MKTETDARFLLTLVLAFILNLFIGYFLALLFSCVGWTIPSKIISFPLFIVSLVLALELVSLRSEPENSIGPVTHVRKAYSSFRDRLVIFLGFLIGLATFAVGDLELPWYLSLLLAVVGFFAGWLVCFLFGSAKLRQDLTPHKFRKRIE